MNEDMINAGQPSAEEQRYNKSKLLFDSMSCMTATEEKVKIYKKLSKEFSDLGDLNDAKELSKQCVELAKEAKIMADDAKLEEARELLENAKTADDVNKADKLLVGLKNYKDAEELHAQCKSSYDKLLKKRKRSSYRFYFIVVCVIGLIFFSRTNLFRFQLGRVVGKVGMNQRAVSLFSGAKGYKNSEKYLKLYSYKAGNDIMSGKDLDIKDYDKAKSFYLKAKGYKKSNQYVAEIEQKRLEAKNVGDKIKIADCNWIIAEKQQDKVLLVKENGMIDVPYSTSIDKVTWETSSIREYLNNKYLKETFTKEQRKYIIDTQVIHADNSQYQISGGNDTMDKIFILSAEEQLKYEKVLNKHTNNSWLRNPGAKADAATFINPKGQIMYYGYQVDSNDILAVPAFWYQIK